MQCSPLRGRKSAGAADGSASVSYTHLFLGMNGFDELPVYAPIPVRCAFTGNEVITFGVPAPGQVRDAFGGFMEHAIISAGDVYKRQGVWFGFCLAHCRRR